MGNTTGLVAPTDTFDLKDRISQLPDDIRVSILSRLTLKESVSTGILSKRWRNLWTRVTVMDFNASESLGVIIADAKSDEARRAKFINWVNSVIDQYGETTMDELRIRFDLDKSCKSAIDDWVGFAVTKRVKKLALDFPVNYDYSSNPLYAFPYEFLSSGEGQLDSIPRQVEILTGLTSLKDLSLRYVNVCDKALEFILSRCHCLENLSIYESFDLENVKVTGSSLKLKHIDICDCANIESVEISNVPELVSFDYSRIANLKLDNVPMLEKIFIGVDEASRVESVFSILSSCSDHLGVLTLDILGSTKEIGSLDDIPEFPRLQMLVIKAEAWWDHSLLDLTTVVGACPNLNKFVLQLDWNCPLKQRKGMRKAPKCELKSLRILEFKGYYGRKSDLELVMYFIENAPSLERIVIDPRDQSTDEVESDVIDSQFDEVALGRKHANAHIKPKVPNGVDLMIL